MINEDLLSTKASVTVALGTLLTTAAGVLEMLQPWLTALGTVAGGVLSLVLAYVHLRRWQVEHRKLRLEVQLLEQKVIPAQAPLPPGQA